MLFETPVAFLIFNRPHFTKQVFKAIAEIRPKRLLVVADGPRTAEEARLCEETREVISQINWDCELRTNFSEVNLGCRRRVSTGLNWVFSEVDEAIILEDDCLPAPSFFPFCASLLERYRDDTRVMHIGGTNLQRGIKRTSRSYYFSRYPHVWGWASWRRAWQKYDVAMRDWPEVKDLMMASFADPLEAAFWANMFERVYRGEIDTWDFQWVYSCWAQSGFSIIPAVNLVSNIGFGPGATHTQEETADSRIPVGEICEVDHPPTVIRHSEADAFTFDHSFGGLQMRQPVPAAPASGLRRLAGLPRKALRRFST